MDVNLETILGTLFSSALVMDLVRALISRWSKGRDEQHAEELKRDQEVIEDRRRLEAQIREDYSTLREENKQMKVELRTLEQKYWECELRSIEIQRKQMEAERGREELREQMQMLQLEYDELKNDFETHLKQ